jgi:hypothetical protein
MWPSKRMKNYRMKEIEGVGWIGPSRMPLSEKLLFAFAALAVVAAVGALIYTSFPHQF